MFSLDIYSNGSKSMGNTARNSNYFLLQLPLLSLDHSLFMSFSVHILNVLLSHIGWDGILAFLQHFNNID